MENKEKRAWMGRKLERIPLTKRVAAAAARQPQQQQEEVERGGIGAVGERERSVASVLQHKGGEAFIVLQKCARSTLVCYLHGAARCQIFLRLFIASFFVPIPFS